MSLLKWILVAASLLVAAGPANATILSVTYTGQTSYADVCLSVTLPIGIPPCQTVADNQSFSGSFLVDTSSGSPGQIVLSGGTGIFAPGPMPITYGALTLGLVNFGTATSLGNDVGVYGLDNSGQEFVMIFATTGPSSFNGIAVSRFQRESLFLPGTFPLTLDQNFSLTNPAGSGAFSYEDEISNANGKFSTRTVGSFTSFNVRPLDATRVPEPWTLSLFGAGIVATFTARRRKKVF